MIKINCHGTFMFIHALVEELMVHEGFIRLKGQFIH